MILPISGYMAVCVCAEIKKKKKKLKESDMPS